MRTDKHEQPGRTLRTRRSVLRDGTVIGLSVVGAAGLAAASRARLALATAAEDRRPDEHLVLNYLPSQPTGWPKGPQDTTVGMTIGGHTPSLSFTRAGTEHSIRLISFGQTASAPDPIYVPGPDLRI